MAEKKENLHEGHRQRMWKKYLDSGINIFSEHEILEMLLYMFIPRQNTNPTAHSLIKQFGSLQAVINAPRSELVTVPNIGPNTAMQISFINDLADYLNKCSQKPAVFESPDAVIKYCKEYFKNKDKECVAAFLLDKKMRVIGSWERELERQGSDTDISDLLTRISQYGCNSIVLAHNHTEGSAYSSNHDTLFTRSIYKFMTAMKVKITDHIVIKGESGYSIRNSGEASDIW